MLSIWWPALLVPVWMGLSGWLKRKLPWNYYHSSMEKLDDAQQKVADETLYHLLSRFCVVFALIAVMTMQSLRLLPRRVQLIIEFFVIMAQVVGVLLLALPVRRAVAEESEREQGDTE